MVFSKNLGVTIKGAVHFNRTNGIRSYSNLLVAVDVRIVAIRPYGGDPNKMQVTFEPLGSVKVIQSLNQAGLYSLDLGKMRPRDHFNHGEFLIPYRKSWNSFAQSLKIGQEFRLTGLLYTYQNGTKWSIDPVAIAERRR